MRISGEKRFFSIFLAVVLALSQIGITAYAEEGERYIQLLQGTNDGYQETVVVDVDGNVLDEYGEITEENEDMTDVDSFLPPYYASEPQVELESPYGLGGLNLTLTATSPSSPVNWNNAPESAMITPAKNQFGYGLCWAFAAVGVMESNLLTNKIISKTDKESDLSEIYVAWFAKRPNQPGGSGDGNNSETPISGGNLSMITPLLAEGIGLQTEEAYPYINYWSNNTQLLEKASGISKSTETQVYTKTVLDNKNYFAVLSEQVNYGDKPERELIKECILKNGSVSCSYYATQTVASKDQADTGVVSYYSGAHKNSPNHGVSIVGWDDDYDKSKFGGTQPNANGAWLAKNSWGAYSKNGFFWISYEEGSLGNFQSIVFEDAKDKLAQIYSHNGSGYQTGTYKGGYGAVIYDVKESGADDEIISVGTSVWDGGNPLEIKVYTSKDGFGGNPVNGNLAASCEVTYDYPGYYNITLPDSVSLSGSKQFSVVIRYVNAWIPAETVGGGNTSSKQSYLSMNGTTFKQCGGDIADVGDLCIKAYAYYPGKLVANYDGLANVCSEAAILVEDTENNATKAYDEEQWKEFTDALDEAREILKHRDEVTDSSKDYGRVRTLTEKLKNMLKRFKDASVYSGGRKASFFTDSFHTKRADRASLIWANGGNVKENGVNTNKKVSVIYTDIAASDIKYLTKKGKERKKKGKIVAGVTFSNEVPQFNDKKKISDTGAAEIAKVAYKKGKLTVTAKKAGTVYAWVRDTGDAGAYAYIKIDIKAAAVKMNAREAGDEEGKKKSVEIPIDKSRTFYVSGFMDKNGTPAKDATYEVSVPDKLKDNISISTDGSGSVVNIKGDSLNKGKKTKVKVRFSSRQNGKKTYFTVILTNPIVGYGFEYGENLSVTSSSGGIEDITMTAPTSKAAVTAKVKVTEIAGSSKEKTTDKTIIRAMGNEGGYTFTPKKTLKITAKPLGESKKITAKHKNGEVSFTAKKGTPAGTTAYFVLFSNADGASRIMKVTLK